MAGIEDDQILDAADDAPIAAHIYFALIAGVEPAIAQHFCGFLRAIPVAGKNVGAANDDFFVFGELHFDARNGGTHVAGFDGNARIVERAERGGFGESVGLQHGNAEHQKKLLGLRSERRGTANKRAKIAAETLLHFGEDEFAAEQRATSASRACAAANVLALPGLSCPHVKGTNRTRLVWRYFLRRRV